MQSDQIETTFAYRQLVASRRRFRLTMTAIMILIYYGFILFVALAPKALARPFYSGASTSTGIVAGVCVVLLSIGMTGYYVLRSNREFDPAMSALLLNAERGA
ncbi:DUF485 domain-containing protein [Paraburkholderia bengalensis]|uniref:DUF485 domain-containing protein n=1 Tax=Paraburkholderia bengalensis TaxID=2747562 RepID=A0ABU8IQW2_9BURK